MYILYNVCAHRFNYSRSDAAPGPGRLAGAVCQHLLCDICPRFVSETVEMTHRSWRTENIKNAQADGVCLLSCKDLKIWYVLHCFILYFQYQEWASFARWTVKLAALSVWCLLYLVLSDDPVGLRWFSPLQDDLLLISAALKWLQRNRTRHCGNHHSHTPQKLIALSETFKKSVSQIHVPQPRTSCSVNICFNEMAQHELFKD